MLCSMSWVFHHDTEMRRGRGKKKAQWARPGKNNSQLMSRLITSALNDRGRSLMKQCWTLRAQIGDQTKVTACAHTCTSPCEHLRYTGLANTSHIHCLIDVRCSSFSKRGILRMSVQSCHVETSFLLLEHSVLHACIMHLRVIQLTVPPVLPSHQHIHSLQTWCESSATSTKNPLGISLYGAVTIHYNIITRPS